MNPFVAGYLRDYCRKRGHVHPAEGAWDCMVTLLLPVLHAAPETEAQAAQGLQDLGIPTPWWSP